MTAATITALTSVDYSGNYKNERSQMPHMVSELHEVSTHSPDVASLWKKYTKMIICERPFVTTSMLYTMLDTILYNVHLLWNIKYKKSKCSGLAEALIVQIK